MDMLPMLVKVEDDRRLLESEVAIRKEPLRSHRHRVHDGGKFLWAMSGANALN